jgi:carboxylesterase type B
VPILLLTTANLYLTCNQNISGASHGSDLGYLFDTMYDEDQSLPPNEEDMKLSSKMLKMWINFAKTG